MLIQHMQPRQSSNVPRPSRSCRVSLGTRLHNVASRNISCSFTFNVRFMLVFPHALTHIIVYPWKQQACGVLNVDLISIDLTERLPFYLKLPQVTQVGNSYIHDRMHAPHPQASPGFMSRQPFTCASEAAREKPGDEARVHVCKR